MLDDEITENNNDNNDNNNINYKNITIHDYQPHLYSVIDNEIQGDTISSIDKDNFRILSSNMQGFQAPKLHKWLATVNKIKEFEADIVAMCETKVNWDKKSLRKQFQSGLHNKSPGFGK
jgi:hypothetical protein